MATVSILPSRMSSRILVWPTSAIIAIVGIVAVRGVAGAGGVFICRLSVEKDGAASKARTLSPLTQSKKKIKATNQMWLFNKDFPSKPTGEVIIGAPAACLIMIAHNG